MPELKDVPTPTAAEIVAQLDLRTKVKLLSGRGMFTLRGLPSHDLPGVVVSDGPHGLRQQGATGNHLGISGSIPSTCFPTAATIGSTWDVELTERIGGALGEEAVEQGVAVVLGPGLNIKRHPAGGRCFEYLSEDPHLSGKLAAAMVRGVQAHGVGTSLKHFAVNNQESYRLVVDAVVDERTLREVYLTGFEIAVRESAPWTVMCSYNLINGVYASEHHELLQGVLRDEWGFEGLVVTDWGAANDRVAGVAAGLDLEMPGSRGAFDDDLVSAVADGRLEETHVDRCAERVVALLQRARHDHPASDRDAHHRLGREAAAAGSVLLANSGVLPLSPATERIALIGAFADHPRYQGAGSSQVTPTKVDRLRDLLRARVEGEVTYAAGYDPDTGDTTPDLVSAALAAASGADVAILCVGLPARMESEGFDRETLDLPAGHVQLIEALAATATPVVVVLSNGGAVHVPWAERVDAVLECWLGGQAGAGGTLDVLFGDAEPGGRLAESIPDHVAQLAADRNFPGQPRQVQYREGPYVGYRFHDDAGVPARFPFGHGLSYTSFQWSEPTLDGAGTDVAVRLRVTNVGDRPGSDVVQVYVRDVESTVRRPDKELKGFAKVHLTPGESAEVAIALDRRAFAVWDVAAHDWLVEAGRFEIVVARSSVDAAATLPHDVESTDQLAPEPPVASLVASDVEFEALVGTAIAPVRSTRPFDRNSTLVDLEATLAGRLIGAVIVRVGLKRVEDEFPDPDEATQAMVRAALREGPARGLVLLSGGTLPFVALDVGLAMLNGDWAEARRLFGGAIRRRR